MRILLALAICFSFAGPLRGQSSGTLMGVVVDTAGNPLPGIVIRVQGSSDWKDRTRPSRSGMYQLDLPPGTNVIEAQALEFRDQSASVHIQEGDTVRLNFRLERDSSAWTIWRGCAIEVLESTLCLLPPRVPSEALEVEKAGAWVIRNEREWRDFWSANLGPQRSNERAPDIDWQSAQIVVVGRGLRSGCENVARYVNRVFLNSDGTMVFLGPDHIGIELICAGMFAPVDVVMLPRGYGPVRFEEVPRNW